MAHFIGNGDAPSSHQQQNIKLPTLKPSRIDMAQKALSLSIYPFIIAMKWYKFVEFRFYLLIV